MGFLSSLFQSNPPMQQVAGAPINTSKLPEELAPYYKDIMGKAQALYNDRTAEGYKPYSGPTMADFTPEQQQAFTGIAGLQGSQAPVFGEAMDLTRSAAAPMTSEQMTQYMSPYQQAVTDIEKREATKQYEGQVQPQLAAQAAATGGFGGSRQAILEGMAADTQQRLLGDIQAKGSQSAYQDAVSRFNVDRQAQGQAGAQLAQLAPNQFKAQLGEIGAMQTVGEQKQRQSQTALDEAFRQYQLERDDPYNTMGKYQSVIQGAPVQKTEFAQPAPPTPSTAQTLLGGIGTLSNAYGAFTGQSPMSYFNKKEGGGLNSIVYAKDSTKDKTVGGELELLDGLSLYKSILGKRATARDLQDSNRGYEKKLHPGSAYMVEDYDMKPSNNLNLRDIEFLPEDTNNDSISVRADVPPLPTYGNENSPMQDILNSKAADGVYADSLSSEPVVVGSSQYPIQGGVAPVISNNSNAPDRPKMPGQIERDFEGEATRMGEARLDKNIGEKEQAYLKTITDKQAKLTERGEGLEEERRREQYMNMAKFFARLGSASPRKEGLMGLIDAGLQVAPESLDAMAATNDKIKKRREEIEDKSSDLDTLLRKEELGIVLSAAERKEKRRLQKNIESNTERTIFLEEKYKEAQIGALGMPEEIKAQFMSQISTHLDDYTKNLGILSGAKNKAGKSIFMNGKIQDKELQSEIQALKTDAIGKMHLYGSFAVWVNNGGLVETDKAMNDLINKYIVKPKDTTLNDNQELNEQEQTLIKKEEG